MKRILVVVFSLSLLQVIAAHAADFEQQPTASSNEQMIAARVGELERKAQTSADEQTCEELQSKGASSEQLAQRGCCSWHQGVCGCNGARLVCCDGTLSPSCQCNKDDPVGIVN